MKHSDIVSKINAGMTIKGLRVEDDGGEARRKARKAQYAEYTGCVHIDDVEIGIRPLPVQKQHVLEVHWDLAVLHEKDGKKYARGLNVLSPAELRAMATMREKLDDCLTADGDIDEFFATLSFHKHEG